MDENKLEWNVCLEDNLKNPNVSVIGWFLEVDFSHPYNIRQKTKYFPFFLKINL